jgi:3',5'-cyclic AMP phosphodiesterase CpdA
MKTNSIITAELLLFLSMFSIQVSAQITRQPYLQIITPTSVVISWQSETGVIGNVYYGTKISSLTEKITESDYEEIYHEVEISGLVPGTKYYYSVEDLAHGTENQYFITAPKVGSTNPVRIWVISDFGQTNSDQNKRRRETVENWRSFNNNSYHADLVLSLGDQTEDDSRYQLQHCYFIPLEIVLKNSPLFTVIGNHDNHDSLHNYLSTFALPTRAEAGGIPSGTEKYYSFDYANIHTVVLSTEMEDDEAGKKAQTDWLKKDLANNKQDWLIACMHRPLHSGGYHRSDLEEDFQERRTEWLPILEGHGVDLVLQGHNHVYERSYLLDNLTGKTTTLTDANLKSRGLGREDQDGAYHKLKNTPHQGTIFLEVPGGGVTTDNFEHYSIFPVYYSGYDKEGSVVIDVHDNRMDVHFICDEVNEMGSHIWDYFTIIKE